MKKKFITILLAFSIMVIPSISKADSDVYMYRIAGKDRYETSAEVSKVSYVKSENAVLVSGENYPDGLTGGVLGSVVNGPVLLTAKSSLPSYIENEILRLGVKNIYIIGGENSVSRNVENSLSHLNVVRIKGDDRIETASNVADYMRNVEKFKVNESYFALANGYSFADALSAGGYLANTKIPLLLTDNKTFGKSNLDFINKYNIDKAILFGGKSSVSPNILPNNIGRSAYSGKDRYETSLNIAEKGFVKNKTVILTSGEEFYDALSSSTIAKYADGPILLTNAQGINKDIVNYIKNGRINRLIVVGGKNKIPNELLEAINLEQIKGPEEIGDINEDPKG